MSQTRPRFRHTCSAETALHHRPARFTWTPETARTEARRLLAEVGAGSDPMTDKSADRVAPTVAKLAERFLVEHAFAKRKPATAAQYRRLFEKYILLEIGRMKVADVCHRDIMRLHADMSALPYQANRILALVSAFFTFAERVGARPDGANPARHVARFREEARERMLPADPVKAAAQDVASRNSAAMKSGCGRGTVVPFPGHLIGSPLTG